MKPCKKNLDKLKTLCDELADRDAQLKINARTLWIVIDQINQAKALLTAEGSPNLVCEKLESISKILRDNKCRRVLDHE